ncbi:hypothetical protein SCE1572_31235 [Sorangium cellulosum So0157-2]|uniref:Uncharacterized protein n=1 Tax=Sorangium cellulosum So0157-2 TaxID=1254432 RepID=S4Y311_SORCE|nr:hypothetical protein SCE1572_31235 [Sorangium cellulosum So0157-2]
MRSKGRRLSSAKSRWASASRSGSSSPLRSTTGTSMRSEGAITCTGSPSMTSMVVRSDSWRRTISFTLRTSESMSYGPRARNEAGML